MWCYICDIIVLLKVMLYLSYYCAAESVSLVLIGKKNSEKNYIAKPQLN